MSGTADADAYADLLPSADPDDAETDAEADADGGFFDVLEIEEPDDLAGAPGDTDDTGDTSVATPEDTEAAGGSDVPEDTAAGGTDGFFDVDYADYSGSEETTEDASTHAAYDDTYDNTYDDLDGKEFDA